MLAASSRPTCAPSPPTSAMSRIGSREKSSSSRKTSELSSRCARIAPLPSNAPTSSHGTCPRLTRLRRQPMRRSPTSTDLCSRRQQASNRPRATQPWRSIALSRSAPFPTNRCEPGKPRFPPRLPSTRALSAPCSSSWIRRGLARRAISRACRLARASALSSTTSSPGCSRTSMPAKTVSPLCRATSLRATPAYKSWSPSWICAPSASPVSRKTSIRLPPPCRSATGKSSKRMPSRLTCATTWRP